MRTLLRAGMWIILGSLVASLAFAGCNKNTPSDTADPEDQSTLTNMEGMGQNMVDPNRSGP